MWQRVSAAPPRRRVHHDGRRRPARHAHPAVTRLLQPIKLFHQLYLPFEEFLRREVVPRLAKLRQRFRLGGVEKA
jgi:hypothetical protein